VHQLVGGFDAGCFAAFARVTAAAGALDKEEEAAAAAEVAKAKAATPTLGRKPPCNTRAVKK
jgi:hypothetical protein